MHFVAWGANLSFSPMGWMRRLCIRIYEVYHSTVPSLTIVFAALWAWLLSTAIDWSYILSSAMLRPRIPASVRSVGALPSPSLGWSNWSVLPLYSTWACIERSFGAKLLFRTSTIWRLERCIRLHCRTVVSLLGVLCGSPLRLTTERRPWALHLST